MKRSALGLLSSLFVVGCGGSGQAFSPYFADSSRDDVQSILADISHEPARQCEDVLVGVTQGNTKEIFAWSPSTRQRLWSQQTEVQSAPILACNYVVDVENGVMMARDARTGRVRFSYDTAGLQLIGADAEGDRFVFVLSTGGGVGASSRVVMTQADATAWVREVDQAVGAPALRGDYVLLPWANQNLSVISAGTASEQVRWQMRDEVVGATFVQGDQTFVGHRVAMRVTPALAAGTRASAVALSAPPDTLPGHTSLMRDAYAAPPPPRSAVHSIRLAWAPAGSGEQLSFQHDSVYLIYYRLIFALDPTGRSVRWVRSTATDIVGATVNAQGLVVTEESGRLSMYAPDSGGIVWNADLGVRPSVAEMQFAHTQLSTGSSDVVPPLRNQLMEIVQVTDARLVPARTFAVQLLGADADATVTENIIVLCETPTWPAPVRQAACDALGERTVGGDYVIAALERHGAYLQGRRVPPVGALAKAAMRMNERRAVPLLIAHLRDPQTPVGDLPALVSALRALGDRSAGEPLSDFVRLYHADEPTPQLSEALAAAVEAVFEMLGPVSEDTLRELSDDPLGMPSVRETASAVLGRISQEATQAQTADEAAQAQQARAAEQASRTTVTDSRPLMLTSAHAEAALGPVRSDLQRCVRSDPSHPASVRIVIVVDGEGQVMQVATTPPSAQSCITPFVQGTQFPANRNGTRQQITYTVRY